MLEYPGVGLEERDEWIDLVEDWSIGGPEADSSSQLHPSGYTEGALAVDGQGRLFVLDNGNSRIQAFDGPSGEFLFSIGRQGEGPGELRRPSRIAIAGNQLVIVDSAAPKLSYWSLGGEHVGDVSAQAVRQATYFAGFSDSTLAVRIPERVGEDRMLVLVRFDGEGVELRRPAGAAVPAGAHRRRAREYPAQSPRSAE